MVANGDCELGFGNCENKSVAKLATVQFSSIFCNTVFMNGDQKDIGRVKYVVWPMHGISLSVIFRCAEITKLPKFLSARRADSF